MKKLRNKKHICFTDGELKEILETIRADRPIRPGTRDKLDWWMNRGARKCVFCRRKIFNTFGEN